MSLFPTLQRWGRDPWSSLQRELNQAFDRALPAEVNDWIGAYPVDIRETEDQVIVKAEMPGFDKKDIDVSLENGVLSIQAQREDQGEGEEHLKERRFTRISRTFTLPKPVDEQNVDAALKDGVLALTLNKQEDSKRQKIEVK
jgi:HSP20 family protein